MNPNSLIGPCDYFSLSQLCFLFDFYLSMHEDRPKLQICKEPTRGNSQVKLSIFESIENLTSHSKNMVKGEWVCNVCCAVTENDTRHCKLCNRCISNYDHHCYWINICIGKNNTRYTSYFLIWGFANSR